MLSDVGRQPFGGRIEQNCAECEAGDVLHHVGVFDCFGGGFAPCEGGVSGDQHSGDCDRVKSSRLGIDGR